MSLVDSDAARPKWTNEELEILRKGRDALGLSFGEISRMVGKTVRQCKYKYNFMESGGFLLAAGLRDGPPMEIPHEVLARRDEHYARNDLRDITARLMGDPLPGESALDMRRAGA